MYRLKNESKFRNRYRIITDTNKGFSVQMKLWWFPLVWFDLGITEYEQYTCSPYKVVSSFEKYIEAWYYLETHKLLNSSKKGVVVYED